MKFENLFSSSGRDPRARKFVPLEEVPDTRPTPEESLLREESEIDEDDMPEEATYEDEDAGVPPEGETQYDRLIALSRNEHNLMRTESAIADEIAGAMDAKGLRPSHRDRRDAAFDYGYRPSHGFRGKEHPDKHQKGGEKTQ